MRLNPWRGLRGLPRDLWVLFSATLVNRAGTMALPFLVLYLTRRFAYSPARAGLALTVYGLGALIVAPFAGRLCDTLGPFRVMKGSLFLSGAALVAFPLIKSFGALLAATFLWSILAESYRPASLSATSDLVPPERRKGAFALIRLAVNLGMSCGPLLGGLLAEVSFPALFFVDGSTSILAGVLLGLSEPTASSHSVVSSPRASGRSPLADGRFLWFLLAVVPVIAVFFQHEGAMAIDLVENLGLSPATYGLLFTINTALIVVLEVPLNLAIARWPHARALSLGSFLIGSGFGLLAFARSFAGVAATVVVWTFGEMVMLPAMSAYVAEIAPPARRGSYMGLFMMASGLAFVVGPWAGTAVLGRFGREALWAAVFAVGLLATAMMAAVGEASRAGDAPAAVI
jgi:MFS family permease